MVLQIFFIHFKFIYDLHSGDAAWKTYGVDERTGSKGSGSTHSSKRSSKQLEDADTPAAIQDASPG